MRNDVRHQPHIYTIVPVLSGGGPLPEVRKIANTQKEATNQVWNELSEDQRNNLEYFDVVDIKVVLVENHTLFAQAIALGLARWEIKTHEFCLGGIRFSVRPDGMGVPMLNEHQGLVDELKTRINLALKN